MARHEFVDACQADGLYLDRAGPLARDGRRRRAPPADYERMEPLPRVGDAQAHLPVGAHGGGHGRRAGRALPAGGPQHGLRHRRGRGRRQDRRGEHGRLAAFQDPDQRRGRPGEDQGPCGDPRQRRVRAALPAVERDLERDH